MVQLPPKLKKVITQRQAPRPKTPVWEGPNGEGPNGGITSSLLQKFLVCPERFRLQVIEGLVPHDRFNLRLEYGNCWHICEEALARGKDPTNKKRDPWEEPLHRYMVELCKKYPMEREQVIHWYEVCKVQFPRYVAYWSKQKQPQKRIQLFQEECFDVPYTLPSGRQVRLRGKWDSVDMEGKGKQVVTHLQENKTKGGINEQQMQRQLLFDCQTGLYLVALEQERILVREQVVPDGISAPLKEFAYSRIVGVRYNVVRRPLSGGRHSISRNKERVSPKGKLIKPEETREAFYKRLGGLIDKEPEWFFMRWNVNVLPDDIQAFRGRFLNPTLERLCDWWECVTGCTGGSPFEWCNKHRSVHWQHPYGVYNYLTDDRWSAIDDHLADSSMVGLAITDNLFPELS